MNRSLRGAACAVAIAAVACGEGTGPGNSVTGIWKGGAFSSFDSLTLVLVDSGGTLTGYGHVYPSLTSDLYGTGTPHNSQVNLIVCGQGCLVLRLNRVGDRLTGTAGTGSTVDPTVTFTRFRPNVSGLPGRWLLTSGAPAGTTTGDTISLTADGRVQRDVGRESTNSSCSTHRPGVVRRESSKAIIDYFDFGLPPQFACGIRTPDTLAIAGATLVRHTTLVGGEMIEEIYERR